MIEIIITLDYELHGNGKGDILKDIINPTNLILDLCDKYKAKLTIMFEIAEFWAFQHTEKEGKVENLGYSPSTLMKTQAQDAIKRGHDVQLHIHPQWIDNEYLDGSWKLKFEYHNLSCLPGGMGKINDINSIKGALYKGKQDLEHMLKKINKEYQCL